MADIRSRLGALADMFRAAPPPPKPLLQPDTKIQGRLPGMTSAGAPLPDVERMRSGLEAMAAQMRGETPTPQILGTSINPDLAKDWAKPEPRGTGSVGPASAPVPPMPATRYTAGGQPIAPNASELAALAANVNAAEGGRVFDTSGPAPVIVSTPRTPAAASAIPANVPFRQTPLTNDTPLLAPVAPNGRAMTLPAAAGGDLPAPVMVPGRSLPMLAQTGAPAPAAFMAPSAAAALSPLVDLFEIGERRRLRQIVEAQAERQRRIALFSGPSPFG